MTTQADKKMMKFSHGSKEIGAQGKTLINKIEIQMDKQRKKVENIRIEHGMANTAVDREHGRYEGLAAALAILRSSTVGQEISRSNERLGIES